MTWELSEGTILLYSVMIWQQEKLVRGGVVVVDVRPRDTFPGPFRRMADGDVSLCRGLAAVG